MLKMKNLSVGYEKKVILSNVSLTVEPGKIITLIGPNGSGKSTVLKTLTRQLKKQGGEILLFEKDYSKISGKEVAKSVSMVMTEKVHPEIMTCREVIATGRYPHTGALGILSAEDWKAVDEAIEMVHCKEVESVDFNKISDGQKQRVMLARAICQNTEILVLDEPTSYLDLFYKLDLMKIVKKLAEQQNKAVIMSLHELDLAKSISDLIVCLNGEKIVKIGTPAEIFTGDFIQKLYGLQKDEFDCNSASLKLNFESSAKGDRPLGSEQKVQKVKGKHAKVLMVQGTMSNAGKSLLVAGLCRVFKQDGYKVAPFKSQNMALNSFITKEGLEMGRAQVMQAEACGIEPSVCMNPILLKPTTDHGSQVIVNGEVIGNMPAREYFKYKTKLIPDIKKAFSELEKQADIIVIEGAGSPAEINLRQNDIVNMGLAQMLDAPVLLVGDIDRGGVFAQLLGTISLLQDDEKSRVKGLVINKFRGDKTILDPGIDMLEEKAGIPVTGVLPYLKITVDDEDSLSSRFEKKSEGLINIGVIRLPRISNFSDFSVFEQMEEVSVHYVTNPVEIEKMDMVIIPGSKNTIGDLKWLREGGMEAAVKKFAAAGGVVFGICGGYQMLGNSVGDPDGVEEGGEIRGLELLQMNTVLKKEKTRSQVSFDLGQVEGILSCLSGNKITGYEIHMGESSGSDVKEGLSQNHNIYGSYVHGFFDDGEVAFKVVEAIAQKKGVKLSGKTMDYKAFKESQYDILADAVREYMDMEAVYGMLREADF